MVNQSHAQHPALLAVLFPRYSELSHSEGDRVSCDRALRCPNPSLKASSVTDLLPSDLQIRCCTVLPFLGTINKCLKGAPV